MLGIPLKNAIKTQIFVWKTQFVIDYSLVNAGIAHKLHLVSTPELPLSGMADYTYFKVYMSDVGGFITDYEGVLNIKYKDIIRGELSWKI